MKDIELRRLRHVRIWIDEVPQGFGPVITSGPTLCVEALIPKGPMMMYGLLGGSWDAESSSNGVAIDVAQIHVGQPFLPISSVVGDVQSGAPESLLGVAAGRASRYIAIENAGKLTLAWSAHSAAWSNEVIFGALGEIIAAGLTGSVSGTALDALLEAKLP